MSDLNNTVGALFLGTVGSAFLYGFTSLQTYWYFHRWVRDPHVNKFAVALLWILDTLHLAFVIHAVYTYVATGFGNLPGLEKLLWSIKTQVAINTVVVVIVQSLYTHRVWILSGYHRGLLGYFAVLAVIASFVSGIVLNIKLNPVGFYTELDHISSAIDASLATPTAADFMIAATMCFYLRKSKTTHSQYLNSRIARLMQFTVSSGLLTSAGSLSAMILYILFPDNFIYLAVQFILTKLYIGSFMAMLNARSGSDGGGSSRYDSEASKSTPTPLRVHLHTVSYTNSAATPPSGPDHSLSKVRNDVDNV